MAKGRFGIHGGQYIPELLMSAVGELEEAYEDCKRDPAFNRELADLLNNYAGRPSRLYFARRMTEDLGGAKVYLKREDLNHTGSHKINNVLGQALLAKRMGKTRLIAETGAGQHGVATATAAALMGMECEVFMGREDTERQALNVYRMRLLGARVHAVDEGTATLKDAVSATFREWTQRIDDTHYVLGSVMGPHPFPTIVRDFQAVISREIKQQLAEAEGRLPDAVLACVGGGSNAIGALPLHRRAVGAACGLRGRRARRGRLRDSRHRHHGQAGHLPRHEELLLPGRPGADRTRVLHLRRAGLSGRGTRARGPARRRARRVRGRDR